MDWAPVVLSAAHWLGVSLYLGSFVFLLLIFQRIYGKYKSYKYVDNFRAEIITLYWRFLHMAFLLIVVSGAGLAGLKGKSILKGVYGLVFSLKLVLWLVQIYLTQEALKPFPAEVQSIELPGDKKQTPVVNPFLILTLLLLIAFCGFALKYL